MRDLPDLLRPGDALVLNDTRVIPARLFGLRARGEATARVEIMLHKREAADRWRAFARPAKRLAVGDRIRFGEDSESMACLLASLDAEVLEKGEGGEVLLRFAFTGPALDEAVERLGQTPLPPYIAGKRRADDRDRADYQTVYAKEEGAVAAPTAGLHFTDALFARLEARGVSRHFVTLHVGAGTFLPVKAEDTADHRMHAEWGALDADTAAALNAAAAPAAASSPSAPPRCGSWKAPRVRTERFSRSRARPTFLLRRVTPSGRGRADDQLPPAALDPVHAGRGLRRARHDAVRLRPRDCVGLSLLLVWGCVFAVSARPVIPAGAPGPDLGWEPSFLQNARPFYSESRRTPVFSLVSVHKPAVSPWFESLAQAF